MIVKKTELRPYQVRGIKALYAEIAAGYNRLIWCYPPGAGKSTMSSRFVEACLKNGKNVLFVVHAKELVEQFHDRLLEQFHIQSGIIMSKVKPRPHLPVQVASIQTLRNRKLPPADVVIIDEAHRSKAASYRRLFEFYTEAKIIGLTATPFRGDGKGLGDLYEKIVQPTTMMELINDGWLVPTKVFGPADGRVDLSRVDIKRGDYDIHQMYDAYAKSGVATGVITNWLKNANGLQTIVFNVNIEHCQMMHDLFEAAGIKSANFCGNMTPEERVKIIADFRSGAITVLNTVGIVTEGFDVPACECVVLNRATKSLGLYVQMDGRAQRPAPGKKFAIILDHGENTMRHGPVEFYDQRKFTLEDTPKKKKKKGEIEEEVARECPRCSCVLAAYAKKCNECGYEFPVKRVEIKFSDAKKFVCYDRDALLVGRLISMRYKDAIKQLPLSQLRLFALVRGYKRGWWFNHAIDDGHVDIDKNTPGAFSRVKFLIEMAERESGISELVRKINKEKSQVSHESVQWEVR